MRLGEASNDKDLLQAAEEARNRRLELRRPWETVWWNNLALLAGDHYAEWNADRGEYVEKRREDYKVRMVLNHALTVARTELARLTKQRPIMEVIPRSSDSEDISAVRLGKYALENAEWKFKLSKQRRKVLWWMIATGVAGTYVGYNPDDDADGTYDFTVDPTTGEPTFNPDRINELKEMVDRGELPELPKESYPLGDLEFKEYNAFQLLPDETALEWDELNSLITTDVVDVDEARMIWGRRGRDLHPDAKTLGAVTQRMLMTAGLNINRATEAKNACEVHTLWLKPGVYRGRYLRNGLMLRWTNKSVILEISRPFPFNDGEIPFAFYEHIPSATTIWPQSILQHVRGPNLEMDKTVSQLIENKDYMANPIWRVATQHQIRGSIKNVAGSVVRYVHVPNTPPPERIEGTALPSQVENLVVALRDQILDISGQGETSRGRVPSGVRSGVAVAYLQEEDETRLGPTIQSMEEAIARQAFLTLSRYSQYYTTTRLIRIYKKGGQFDIYKFKGADLKNNTDVNVQAGSAMPRMKAAKQQFALDMAQQGLIQKKRLMDILELGEGEPDDTDKAYAQADRENQAMVQGVLTKEYAWDKAGNRMPTTGTVMGPGASGPMEAEPQFEMAPPDPETGQIPVDQITPPSTPTPGSPEEPQNTQGPMAMPVKNWHNHEAHLERHYSFMMDESFERLAITHPDIVRLFDEHTAMHKQILDQERQAQMQMLMAAKGAPSSNGAGPTPMPEGQPDMMQDPQAAMQQATQ